MTEQTKITVHPDSLALLKEVTPLLEQLAKSAAGLDLGNLLQDAVNELRQNFPGLDDLTLAAFCAYRAESDFFASGGGPELMQTAITSAVIALELAKEIR